MSPLRVSSQAGRRLLQRRIPDLRVHLVILQKKSIPETIYLQSVEWAVSKLFGSVLLVFIIVIIITIISIIIIIFIISIEHCYYHYYYKY